LGMTQRFTLGADSAIVFDIAEKREFGDAYILKFKVKI